MHGNLTLTVQSDTHSEVPFFLNYEPGLLMGKITLERRASNYRCMTAIEMVRQFDYKQPTTNKHERYLCININKI